MNDRLRPSESSLRPVFVRELWAGHSCDQKIDIPALGQDIQSLRMVVQSPDVSRDRRSLVRLPRAETEDSHVLLGSLPRHRTIRKARELGVVVRGAHLQRYSDIVHVRTAVHMQPACTNCALSFKFLQRGRQVATTRKASFQSRIAAQQSLSCRSSHKTQS